MLSWNLINVLEVLFDIKCLLTASQLRLFISDWPWHDNPSKLRYFLPVSIHVINTHCMIFHVNFFLIDVGWHGLTLVNLLCHMLRGTANLFMTAMTWQGDICLDLRQPTSRQGFLQDLPCQFFFNLTWSIGLIKFTTRRVQ